MGKHISIWLLALLIGLSLVKPAYAATWKSIDPDCVQDVDNHFTILGLNAGGGSVVENVVTLRGIKCLVINLTSPIPAIIVLSALVMIIYAGARIVTAGSDPKALSSAMQMLTWAIVGIILLPVAWLILITIEKFTGVKVTEFGIP